MRTMISTMFGLGLVAMLAGPVAAQGQGRGFGMFGGYGALLGNASVQKELKLDDQQVEKAKELAQSAMAKLKESRSSLEGLEGQERFTKMQEINREINASTIKSAGEFLKPEQVTRLKQISYQQRGAQAFHDPEVQQKLNLTDSQKSDIDTVIRESGEEIRKIREETGDDREAAAKRFTELRKTTLAKAEGKLNDEQQKTWKELLGASFEVKYERPNN